MPLPPELIERRNGKRSRLGDLIARLSSDSRDEQANAANLIVNTLKAHGSDIHDFIDHLEAPPLNAYQIAEIQKAIDEKAKQLAEAGKVGAPRPNFNDFRSTDGSDDMDDMDDWRQLAIHIDENKHRLSPHDYNDWAREFIDDMAVRARFDLHYQARPKQYVQLRKFAIKVGWRTT
jgi:hypothetical protein